MAAALPRSPASATRTNTANIYTAAQTFTTANITITDVNIVLSTTTGTKIGTGASQKLGLWNATPVVQPSGASQAAIGSPTYAAPDATPAAITGGESPTEAEHNALRSAHDSLRTQVVALAADVATHKTLVNKLRTDLIAIGAIKGSA